MKRSTYTLRRLLALVLVLVMVGSLFAACSKKPDPTEPSEPSGTTAETAAPTEEPTQAPTDEPTEAPTEPVETVPPVLMGTVNADNLNVRSEPYSTSDILKRLAINTRIEILEQKIVDGVNWGRIAEGWVNLNYVTIGVEFPEPGTSNVVTNDNNIGTGSVTTNDNTTGTVTTGLNIRKESNADSASVGTYKKGDKVTILERNGNWGRTNKGWINTKYVDFTNSVTADSSTGSSSSGTNSTTVSNGNKAVLGYGTVVKTTSLAIRSGPGANYTQVSYVRMGERHAYYQTSTNGWVRFQKGWVNADYLTLEYAVESGTEATVTATTLSVREDADYNSERLATLEKGDEVTILETKGTWGMIEYSSGQYGWIDLDQVKLPTPVVSNYSTGIATITADALHIREKASAASDSLGTYKKGDKVTVTEVNGNWGKTEDGWISLKYTKMEKTYTTGTGTVTASSLNIRSTPSTSGADLGSLKNGTKVTILDTEGNWGKIEYATGKYGWISLSYVNMTSTSTDSSSSSTSGKYKITIETPDNGVIKASASSANKNSTITLTATPATGFVLGDVTVTDANGTAVAVTNKTSFVMPAANVTVVAEFIPASEAETFEIEVQAAGGDVALNVEDEAAVPAGQKVVMTITPDTGYALSSLSVTDADGKTVSVVSNSYFIMPEANVTIKATFAENTTDVDVYTITLDSAIPEGAVIANTRSAAEDAKVTLTVTAPEGYTVKSVSVKKDSDSKTVSVSGTGATRTFTMPDDDVTVFATFEAKKYTISTSKVGSGTVSTNTSECTKGTEITATATPAAGYKLTSLKVYGPNNAIVASGTTSPVSFDMPAYNVTVKATFEKEPHTISVTPGEGGDASADKEEASEGTKITLTVEPEDGYKLDKITVNGKTISGKTFTMPAADADVEVTFKKVVYTITAKTATGGTIKVSPATAEMDDLVTVTFTPKDGYELTAVSIKQGDDTVSGVSSDGNVYSFPMPAGNVTVTATFTKIATE